MTSGPSVLTSQKRKPYVRPEALRDQIVREHDASRTRERKKGTWFHENQSKGSHSFVLRSLMVKSEIIPLLSMVFHFSASLAPSQTNA